MSIAADRKPLGLTPSNELLAHKRAGLTRFELILSVITISVFVFIILSAASAAREAARRSQCLHNFQQIGFALQNYHDTYGELPPAYTVDAEGKPLHSWRTLLLPYLDQQELYDQIDLTKPWNAPENAAVLENGAWLQCPNANLSKSETTYLAIVTDTSCLRPGRSLAISEITDGTSHTMCLVEVGREIAVPWMKPHDLDEAGLLAFGQKTAHSHPGGRYVLLMDGFVRFLPQTTRLETVKALATAAGGETVSEY
jgi:hypothetical protein